MNQNPFARHHSALREQRIMRSHENLRYGGSFGPTEVVRNLREMIFRNCNEFSLSATADDAEHSIPSFPIANLLADRFNFAGKLQSGDFLRISGRRGIAPEPLQNVCAIQSRRAHSHAHAIGGWLRRVVDLTNLEAFNAAERSDVYGFHWFVLTRRI